MVAMMNSLISKLVELPFSIFDAIVLMTGSKSCQNLMPASSQLNKSQDVKWRHDRVRWGLVRSSFVGSGWTWPKLASNK